jgi:tRNA A-37 threonylcarbamoyl transferase component Bud32
MPIIERYRQYEIAKRPDGSLWQLGAGAMGITYKAFDTNLHRYVALKVINDTYLGNVTAREQFLREARSAAALRHPNVASIHDLGTDHDCHFYVMELIEGTTVKSKIERDGPMTPKVALGVILQVAQALMAAEKQKLIHRDLKPANLMLVEDNDELAVKIIDFGLAKTARSLGESTASFTIGGGFVGTAEYASPEQIKENELDIRSDIYSVGATLFYMLVGRPPFIGSPGEVMSKHLYKPVPLERLVGVPPPMVALVERLMEKERENRPANSSELRISVEQCLEQISPSTLASQRLSENPTAFSVHSATGLPEKSAAKERYNLLKRLDQTPQGERFLALDKRTGNGVEVFTFNHNALANAELIAALKSELKTLRNAPHPLLRAVFAFEEFHGEARLVQESFAGLPLLAILRRRKAFSPTEINLLLARLAPLADFAQRYDLKQVDLNLAGIWLGGSRGSAPRPENPLQSWDPLEIKVDPIDLSSSPSASRHSQREVTAINPIAIGGPRGSYLRQLSLLAYELLGGPRQQVETSGRCPPLSLLNEDANVVLRRGIIDEFSSAAELATAFNRALPVGAGREPEPEVRINELPDHPGAAEPERLPNPETLLEPAKPEPRPIINKLESAAPPPSRPIVNEPGPAVRLPSRPIVREPGPATHPPSRPILNEPEPAAHPPSVGAHVVPNQYPTIQAAIDAAEVGSIVLVKPGVYQEALKFKEGIELCGENPEMTVVHWTGATPIPADRMHDFSLLAIVDCQFGTVRDLSFVYEGSESTDNPGETPTFQAIQIRNSSVTIQNCRATGFPGSGIGVFGNRSSPVLIGNQCRSNHVAGIAFRDGAQGKASQNLCEENEESGILASGAGTTPELTENRCRGNRRDGIMFRDGTQGISSRNLCEQNFEHGILVTGLNTAPLLLNNQCRDNQAAGIYFMHGAKGRAENNVCENNAWCGIMVIASAPYLSGNELRRNSQCGLAYDSKSKLSLGKRNVFSENKQGDLLTKPIIQDRG